MPSYFNIIENIFHKFWDAESDCKIYRKSTALCDLSTDECLSLTSRVWGRPMCMCLLTTCSRYQSWSGKDFEFCHFCPRAAIGHSTNECMKQWKGEIYSDAWSVENWTYVPVVSAWLNADILYVTLVHTHRSPGCAFQCTPCI